MELAASISFGLLNYQMGKKRGLKSIRTVQGVRQSLTVASPIEDSL